ncbi:MotA/TolQ/ExbB proton channel family protein [Albimonas sp. CAU 1670]|uniref:MotA/TolQ/ExbB proton channel family protein n=1 Tax=Albimonas sp. CAU 1670 TaxID=3032599 RepID=UPI0023DAE4E0|nr:MotA/TolQ/ExbB proton channel family protein [Albimonas sp. CAU 1670]MDF2235876.1 MotA/TolQ/ExbB proton channel family protein [Albimonas sp. CAU 1670]
MTVADHTSAAPRLDRADVAWTPQIALPLAMSLALALALGALVARLAPPGENAAVAAVSIPRYLDNDFCFAIVVSGLWAVLYGLSQLAATRLEQDALAAGREVPRELRRMLGAGRLAALVDGEGAPDRALGASVAADRFDARRGARMAPVSYAIWALPLLGFVGTVVGISGSIGGLEGVFEGGGERNAALREVLASLRYAFDTTFVGLAMVLPTMAVSVWHKARSDAARHVLVARIVRG